MAEPDPHPDMASTRLRPSEWTAPAATPSAGNPPAPGRAGLWTVLPWILLLALLAAAIALALSGGLRLPGERTVPVEPSAPAPAPALPPSDPRIEEMASRLEALEAAPVPKAAGNGARTDQLVARVEALESEARRLAEAGRQTDARLNALITSLNSAGVTASAAAATTARARDYFILLGVRRQVERGRPLGALEPALRAQFNSREPAATAALAAWSRAPVSPLLLREQLVAAPTRPEPPLAGQNAWQRLWRNLVSLVELRRTEQEAASQLRERAASALARGDLASGIAIAESAPVGTVPQEWIADARRLSAALDALDRLEIIALQDSSAGAAAPAR